MARLAPRVPAKHNALGIASFRLQHERPVGDPLQGRGAKLKLAYASLPTPETTVDGTGPLDPDVRVWFWGAARLVLTKTSVMRCSDAIGAVAAHTLHL